MAGALRITSTRHYIDFAAMTPGESASFGPLYSRLDAALRAVTGAERVHLVSTRDRIQHFHAGSIHAPRNTHYAAPNSSMPLNAAIPRRLNAPPTR
jgi:hypothetical protein